MWQLQIRKLFRGNAHEVGVEATLRREGGGEGGREG